ncbi:MAG: type VI secretion system protein TssA, partial [Planctomycetota bacterium]
MIDLETLLRPIREEVPTGDNLRADPSPTSPYYQIKDARNAARVSERAALQSDDPMATLIATSSSDWAPVAKLAPALLTEVSKDIEIAVWWIEALLRREGFAGLREGFELARRMIEDFWDGLHPLPDEEGLEVRVAPLTGLNGDDAEGTLIVPIGMVPLLSDDKGPLSAWHYKMARDVAAIVDPEAKQRRIDAGAVTLDRFSGAVAMTDPAALFAARDEVEACMAEWTELSVALDQRCGAESPPSSNVRQALEDVVECLTFLTKDLTRPGGQAEAVTAD